MAVRTTVVTGQIINPLTGRVVANKRLSVRLYPDVVYSADGTQQIIRSSWISTDATGTFSEAFQVNADLDPAGSYYTVQVAPGLIDSLIVPVSTGPVTYRSCLVSNPANPNPIQAGISQDQLTAETTRATTAETANATAITAEATTARAAEALKLAKASNLSDVANAATALGNLGGASATALATTNSNVAANTSNIAANTSAITALPNIYVPQGGLPPIQPAINNVTEQIVSNYEAGSGVTVTGAGSYAAADTSDFVTGTQAVRVTTDGAGTPCNITLLNQPPVDTTDKFIKIRFKADAEAPYLYSIKLQAGSGGLTDYWQWIISQAPAGENNTLDAPYWQVDTLNWHHPSKVGSPDRTKVTDWRLIVTDYNGGSATVHLDGISLVDNGVAIWPQGVVSITFDDCYDGQYLYARPAMDKYGFRGTSYPIWERFGQAGRMTMAQARDMHDVSGWEFGSHAATAAAHDAAGGMTSLSIPALVAEFEVSKAKSYAEGFRGLDHFSWPQSKYNHATVAAARQFFTSIRTTYDQSGFETFPPANPLWLRSWSIHNDYTPASVLAYVAGCMQHRSWLILDFHQLAPTYPGVAPWYGADDFQTLMDGIAALGVPVRTIGEVLATKRSVGGAHAASSLGWFGDGSDGVASFDGTTGVRGTNRVGSVYTLTRDVFYTAVTVASGVTLNPDRFRVFARDSLVNSGLIACDGNPASGATGGSAKVARASGGGTGGGSGTVGGAGGAGGAAAIALGGSGGDGGAATGGGVGGGTVGGATAAPSANGAPRHAQAALACAPQGTATLWLGGAGGSGGAANAGATGGGAGGGAPCVVIAARVLISTGIIGARGGAGGAGAIGTGTGAGGGGGGGGGALLLVYNTFTNSGSLDVSGGLGGVPAGVGATGAAGSAGAVFAVRA